MLDETESLEKVPFRLQEFQPIQTNRAASLFTVWRLDLGPYSPLQSQVYGNREEV